MLMECKYEGSNYCWSSKRGSPDQIHKKYARNFFKKGKILINLVVLFVIDMVL